MICDVGIVEYIKVLFGLVEGVNTVAFTGHIWILLDPSSLRFFEGTTKYFLVVIQCEHLIFGQSKVDSALHLPHI